MKSGRGGARPGAGRPVADPVRGRKKKSTMWLWRDTEARLKTGEIAPSTGESVEELMNIYDLWISLGRPGK